MVNVSAFIKKKQPQRICFECGGKLVPIGTARCGGKQTHGDWAGRMFHKQCWIKRKRAEEMEERRKLIEQSHQID